MKDEVFLEVLFNPTFFIVKVNSPTHNEVFYKNQTTQYHLTNNTKTPLTEEVFKTKVSELLASPIPRTTSHIMF